MPEASQRPETPVWGPLGFRVTSQHLDLGPRPPRCATSSPFQRFFSPSLSQPLILPLSLLRTASSQFLDSFMCLFLKIYIKTKNFFHEVWNGLYSLYKNHGTNSLSFNLDFSIFHIWVQNGSFPIRNKEISLYFIWRTGSPATETRMSPVFLCYHVSWTFVCVYPRDPVACVCIFVDVRPTTAYPEMTATDCET